MPFALPALIAAVSGRLAPAKKKVGRLPKLNGLGTLAAVLAIIGIPVLAGLFPRSAARLALPLLAITSVGVYLTVADTEHVSIVMALAILAAIVAFAATISPHQLVIAGVAFVIMGAAILDSGSREASIVRAAGCFGVLIAAPVSAWIDGLRSNGQPARQPMAIVLVAVHCVVAGFSSRVLIRQESLLLVLGADAVVFAVTIMVLTVSSRPVAAEP